MKNKEKKVFEITETKLGEPVNIHYEVREYGKSPGYYVLATITAILGLLFIFVPFGTKSLTGGVILGGIMFFLSLGCVYAANEIDVKSVYYYDTKPEVDYYIKHGKTKDTIEKEIK